MNWLKCNPRLQKKKSPRGRGGSCMNGARSGGWFIEYNAYVRVKSRVTSCTKTALAHVYMHMYMFIYLTYSIYMTYINCVVASLCV